MISAVSHHNFDTRLFSGGGPQEVTLTNVGKEEMEEILEDYEEGGREDSGYVVLDVREANEIEYTGKLSPNTITFPLQKLMQYNAFALDDDEFEEIFGFEKPGMDETLVFSCAMGVRSVHAANFAAQAGYSKLVNYKGGANQWFL
jgi:rhodanese-related sulfurtransferase